MRHRLGPNVDPPAPFSVLLTLSRPVPPAGPPQVLLALASAQDESGCKKLANEADFDSYVQVRPVLFSGVASSCAAGGVTSTSGHLSTHKRVKKQGEIDAGKTVFMRFFLTG
jgi:hypothetical protein